MADVNGGEAPNEVIDNTSTTTTADPKQDAYLVPSPPPARPRLIPQEDE